VRAGWLVVLGACGGLDADPGIRAELQIAGAQFVAGAMPASSTDIRVTAIDSLNNTIRAGQINKALSGRVQGDGRAVALGFADDAGYWIVPAAAADLNLPDELTWSARASFAPTLVPGTRDLLVAAVDDHGAFGPPDPLTLTVRSGTLDLTGTKLAFALRWDTEADLDLHVVLPGDPPVIVWWGDGSSYIPPPPGTPPDPVAAAASGILDADSNDQCVIDGRRAESVTWRGDAAAPPHGTYAVLVDAFSLCAVTTAHWTLDVFREGDPASVAHAEGTVVDSDTRGQHVAGSGVRALTFDN